MKTKIENTDIFAEVIEANIQTLVNRMNNQALDFAVKQKFRVNQVMTEDEARYLAVAFFTKVLTERVQELNDNAVSKLLF